MSLNVSLSHLCILPCTHTFAPFLQEMASRELSKEQLRESMLYQPGPYSSEGSALEVGREQLFHQQVFWLHLLFSFCPVLLLLFSSFMIRRWRLAMTEELICYGFQWSYDNSMNLTQFVPSLCLRYLYSVLLHLKMGPLCTHCIYFYCHTTSDLWRKATVLCLVSCLCNTSYYSTLIENLWTVSC